MPSPGFIKAQKLPGHQEELALQHLTENRPGALIELDDSTVNRMAGGRHAENW